MGNQTLRYFQRKDRKKFDATDYPSLFADDMQVLKADLLSEKYIYICSHGPVMVDMPMNDSTHYVAVALHRNSYNGHDELTD